MLPSVVAGPTTRNVGWFECSAEVLADWLVDGLPAEEVEVRLSSLSEVMDYLTPRRRSPRRDLVTPVGDWSLLLNNGVLGTDVGVLPRHAAKELGVRVIRAANSNRGEVLYPARILAVYGPDGDPEYGLIRRSIYTMNDGGRWDFGADMGEPFPFERVEKYSERVKSDRFTSEMLFEYLGELGVPVGVEPDWRQSIAIEKNY